MKVVIDVRKKGTKHHSKFVDFVFGKAIKNQNTEVIIRDQRGSTTVAMNGVVGTKS